MSSTPELTQFVGKYRWRARLYWASLVFVLAGTMFAGALNGFLNPSDGVSPWMTPLVLFVCLLLLAGLLASAVCQRNAVFVVRKYRARRARGVAGSAIVRSAVDLSKRAGIPCPRVYFSDASGLSVLSCGWSPQKSIIILNSQAIEALECEEREALIADELSHIRHRDCLTRTKLAFSVGFMVALGYGMLRDLLLALGRPTVSRLVQLVFLLLFLPFVFPLVWAVGMLMKHILCEQDYRADIESVSLTGDCGIAEAAVKLTGYFHAAGLSTDGIAFFLDLVRTPDGRADEVIDRLFNFQPSPGDRVHRLLEWLKATAEERSRNSC